MTFADSVTVTWDEDGCHLTVEALGGIFDFRVDANELYEQAVRAIGPWRAGRDEAQAEWDANRRAGLEWDGWTSQWVGREH